MIENSSKNLILVYLLSNLPSPTEDNKSPFTQQNMIEPTTMTITFSFVYLAVHLLADKFLIRRYVNSQLLKQLKFQDRVLLTEKVCSSINGFVVGVAGMYLLFVKPKFEGAFGIFHQYPRVLHYIYSSYCGYSLYDMGMMLYMKDKDTSMWIHHIIGFAGAFLMMLYRRAAYFPTAFTLSELTVLPTNWVWVLRALKYSKSSPQYSVAHSLRTLSFIMLRTFVAPVCVYYAFMQMEGNGNLAKWQTFVSEIKKLPVIVSTGTIANVTLLGTLNLMWTLIIGKGIMMKAMRKVKQQ